MTPPDVSVAFPVDQHFLQRLFDAMPQMVWVVDEDARVQFYNRAASRILGDEPEQTLRRRGGDLLNCLHAFHAPDGCGTAPECRHCAIRNSVAAAMQGRHVQRRRHRIESIVAGRCEQMFVLITCSPLDLDERRLVVLSIEDISELVDLRGIIPICSHCKKIREDTEYWQHVDRYLAERLDLEFSHSLCPECARALYPETVQALEANGESL